MKRRTPGDTPIVQSGVAPLVSLVSLDTQLSQIGNLRSGLLPLLPDVHSTPAPHPFIPRHQRPLPTAKCVVVFHDLVVAHAGRTSIKIMVGTFVSTIILSLQEVADG